MCEMADRYWVFIVPVPPLSLFNESTPRNR